MERRFFLGVGLLAVLLVLGLFTAWAMERVQSPMAEKMEQAAVTQELQAGYRLSQEAKADWQKNWRVVAAVADHTPMDEIDKLFAELEVYAREEEQVHFSACCAQLSSLLRAVSDAHSLNWWNLL